MHDEKCIRRTVSSIDGLASLGNAGPGFVILLLIQLWVAPTWRMRTSSRITQAMSPFPAAAAMRFLETPFSGTAGSGLIWATPVAPSNDSGDGDTGPNEPAKFSGYNWCRAC